VVTFLNPLLLYGLALIAVPIIIHFFITRRKIVLDWAAYEFVRRALLKKKNRVEKENLLQLILRILAIAFLAFALARALFGPGRASEHALLLLDSSYSMQALEDGVSRFEKAKRLAKAWIADAPAGSTFAVGHVNANIETVTSRLSENPGDALTGLETLKPSALSATLAEMLGHLLQPVETLKPSRVVIFSDFNNLGRAEELKLRLAALPKDVSLQLVPVTRLLNVRNYALTRLASDSGLILSNRPAVLGVDVMNTTPEPWGDFKLTMQVDGRAAGEVVLDLTASQRVRATFTPTFRDANPHLVTISGPSDALAVDNAAHAYITPLPVIRIAGLEPVQEKKEVFEQELGFFEAAFANLILQAAVKIEKFGPSTFPWSKLGEYRVVVLGNFADINATHGEALSRFVRNGGGLIVFPGANVLPAEWNAWAGRDPDLLPARLEGPLKPPQGWEISPKSLQSPVFGFLQENEEALASVRFKNVFDLKPAENAVVLARFAQEDHPVGVSRPCGRGTVLLYSFPANRAWSDFAVHPTYVPFSIRTLLQALGPAPRTGALPGETLVFTLPPEFADQELVMDVPGARQSKVRALFKDEQAEVRFAGANEPGFYQLLRGEKLLAGSAVNVDGNDSDLTPANQRELLSVTEMSDRVSLAGEKSRSGPGGFPLTLPALVLAALAIAGETWVSFRRKLK
jgi:hypothetical protein